MILFHNTFSISILTPRLVLSTAASSTSISGLYLQRIHFTKILGFKYKKITTGN